MNILNEMLALVSGKNLDIMVNPQVKLVPLGAYYYLSHETKTVKIPSFLTSLHLKQVDDEPCVKLKLLSRLVPKVTSSASTATNDPYLFFLTPEQGRWETSEDLPNKLDYEERVT